MEPEVVAFLKRVAFSVFLLFSWLVITAVIGVKFDLAFTNGKPSIGNVLFYVWMTVSFVSLLLFLIKIWKKVEKW